MFAFAIAGFVFAILFGLYLVFVGLGVIYTIYGFTGQFVGGWLLVSAAGVGVLWFSITHAPFTITLIQAVQ